VGPGQRLYVVENRGRGKGLKTVCSNNSKTFQYKKHNRIASLLHFSNFFRSYLRSSVFFFENLPEDVRKIAETLRRLNP
jgi:hypothetical protein